MEDIQKNWYDKHYKKILLFPVILLIISLIYLGIFYNNTGDIFLKDSSLAGGTTVTLQGNYNPQEVENALQAFVSDARVRTINDITTGKNLAVIIESQQTPEELSSNIERALGLVLDSENSTIEFSGETLSQSFYRQLIYAIIISFILMSIVIFFLFKTFVPSIAVIFAAFADIVMPLALVNMLDIHLSAAGIAAFLMLIGYSVDTDILLTTRVLKKREDTVNKRIYSSFKTGIFMTITALCAVLPAFSVVTGLPDSFRQIFLILAFGLTADILNTWLANAGIIKWYAEAKKIS